MANTQLSVVQIYMEMLQDLLNPQLDEVRIREDPRDGIVLENCNMVRVHT